MKLLSVNTYDFNYFYSFSNCETERRAMKLQGPYSVFQLFAVMSIYLYRSNTVLLNIETEKPNSSKKKKQPPNPKQQEIFLHLVNFAFKHAS